MINFFFDFFLPNLMIIGGISLFMKLVYSLLRRYTKSQYKLIGNYYEITLLSGVVVKGVLTELSLGIFSDSIIVLKNKDDEEFVIPVNQIMSQKNVSKTNDRG